jgi:hypothetical protein
MRKLLTPQPVSEAVVRGRKVVAEQRLRPRHMSFDDERGEAWLPCDRAGTVARFQFRTAPADSSPEDRQGAQEVRPKRPRFQIRERQISTTG